MIKLYKKYVLPLIDGTLRLLYPKICLVCSEKFYPGNVPICNDCQSEIQEMPREIFLKKDQPENIDSLFIPFLFNETYQKVIHMLKYRGYSSVGKWIGKLVAGKQSIAKFENTNTILVPIPLHKIRSRERGYNQARMIAKGIQTRIKLPIQTDLIKRIKNTRSQTHLSKAERIENMKNAFAIQEEYIEKENIILVDDVFTTGTTMNCAAKTLRGKVKGEIVGLASAAPQS